MKKKSAVVILIAIVINMICLVSCETESNKKELGEGPMTCYVEGELLTDKYGDKIVFFDDITCKQQYLEDPSYRVKAIDGKFYMTIHSEHISPYSFVLYEPLIKTATSPHGQFFAENNAHIKIQIFDDRIIVQSDGEEGRKYEALDSIVHARTWETGELDAFRINYYAEHPMLEALYDVLHAAECIHSENSNPEYADSEMKIYESYMKLYEDKLCNTYPEHPIHEQIAVLTRLSPGQPYNDDYDIHTPDGKAVPISSLLKGHVALIDLWGSWCGGCREHSKAVIPLYEKYKDKGFTVVAIAREKNRSAMEKAMKKDGYPWASYMEPINDDNRVWGRHGLHSEGGGMILVDRDGTILSTSTDATVLEPLIKKALNID